ncbi:hypothetical protein C2G38_2235352 [Gigaspora rosea]|uniref:Uncharacterized protein n=1 Tax=Gigaspora rosea TaxID=44941 RepID=A0A397TPQ3_9GLOM|nr:hypothetical protein C2G38_2235352 [Gigaspora rosea]
MDNVILDSTMTKVWAQTRTDEGNLNEAIRMDNLMLNSTMTTNKDEKKIDRNFDTHSISDIPYEFKLLLCGSRDGFTHISFWHLCDKQKI